MTATSEAPRTYGNWSKRRSMGLFGLGTLGTSVMFVGFLLTLMAQAFAGFLTAGACLLMTSVVLAPFGYRNRSDRNGWQILVNHLTWALGRRRRANVYLAPLTSPIAFGA